MPCHSQQRDVLRRRTSGGGGSASDAGVQQFTRLGDALSVIEFGPVTVAVGKTSRKSPAAARPTTEQPVAAAGRAAMMGGWTTSMRW